MVPLVCGDPLAGRGVVVFKPRARLIRVRAVSKGECVYSRPSAAVRLRNTAPPTTYQTTSDRSHTTTNYQVMTPV